MSRRVLVTGATGFIGRHVLAPLRERGFDVHAVARTPPAGDGEHVGWHEADLLHDPTGVVEDVRPTHLVHLAWYAEHGRFWTARENAHWVAATVRLVEAFGAAGGQRAVLTGTCAEYDWAHAGRPLAETAPLAPATVYGISKDATRRACEPLVPELAWGRVFFLHGPREDPRRLVASVARGLARGERVALTEGSQRRDFLHVADVAAALAAVTDAQMCGPVNIASGEAVTVRAVAETLAHAAGRPDLLDFGALESRPGEAALLVADVARLRDEAGFRPAMTLQEGLEATLRSWRDR